MVSIRLHPWVGVPPCSHKCTGCVQPMVCNGIQATSEVNIWSVLQVRAILISAYFAHYLFVYSIYCTVFINFLCVPLLWYLNTYRDLCLKEDWADPLEPAGWLGQAMAEGALCKCHNPDSCLLSLELLRDLSAFIWDQVVFGVALWIFPAIRSCAVVLSPLQLAALKKRLLCKWYLQR